jgi:glycosyltransferase involved in cell wall biosynthesis
MISVVIPTSDSEQALVPTLAALVPGAVAGLIREVIVADAGSRDGTAAVADVAGCHFLETSGARGVQMRVAAAAARAPWLLFLHPGVVPESTWIEETSRFIRQSDAAGGRPQAAVFRRAGGSGTRPPVIEALAALAAAFRTRPRPEQGLLITRHLYEELGGHRAGSSDCEGELLRRLGSRRIAVLRCEAAMAVG